MLRGGFRIASLRRIVSQGAVQASSHPILAPALGLLRLPWWMSIGAGGMVGRSFETSRAAVVFVVGARRIGRLRRLSSAPLLLLLLPRLLGLLLGALLLLLEIALHLLLGDNPDATEETHVHLGDLAPVPPSPRLGTLKNFGHPLLEITCPDSYQSGFSFDFTRFCAFIVVACEVQSVQSVQSVSTR